MSLVVDASVALKWFLPEPDSALAEDLLAGTTALLAPTLIVSEMCNAVWKRLRRGEITAAHADKIPELFGAVGMSLVADETLAGDALYIARRLDHPVYDCFYLALAEQRRATLVTADRRLAARVAGTDWAGRVQALAARGKRDR